MALGCSCFHAAAQRSAAQPGRDSSDPRHKPGGHFCNKDDRCEVPTTGWNKCSTRPPGRASRGQEKTETGAGGGAPPVITDDAFPSGPR